MYIVLPSLDMISDINTRPRKKGAILHVFLGPESFLIQQLGADDKGVSGKGR